MPFKSEKQKRFFQAIAHGWKPSGKKGPSKAVARKFIADSKRGKARGGALRYAVGGPVRPGALLTGRPLPRPGAGSTGGRGGLGSTGRVGALGSAVAAGSGLSAKRRPSGRPVGPLGSIRPAPTPSNRPSRPVPGRGVDPYLARSGQWLADADRRLSPRR